jgi:hypothetical protein
VASRNRQNIIGSGTPEKSHSVYPCEVAGGSSSAEPRDDSSPAEALGSLATRMWRPGGTLRIVVLALALAIYADVALRSPIGKRGPETERSPAGAAAVSPVSASCCEATCSMPALRSRLSRALAGAMVASWRRRTCNVRVGGCWRRGNVCGGDRDGPGLVPRTELLTVGEAHEVAVPRSLKVQAPEPDFESCWEGGPSCPWSSADRGTRCGSPSRELVTS